MMSFVCTKEWAGCCKRLRATTFFCSFLLILVLCGSLATYAAVPAVVGSTQTSLPTVTTDTNMVIADVATDSAGNVFVATAFNWGDGGTITKLPANGGAPQQIAAGLGPLWGLAIGPDGSIYFTDRWNNHVEKIQYLGGGSYGSPSNLFSQIGNLSNWWFGGSDLAVDSTGAIYLSYEWGGGIDKVVNQAGTWTGTHIIGSSPAGEIKHVVLDKNNNIYFTTDSPGAFMIAAGTTSAVAIGTGLVKPTSIAVDDAGNVFIVDDINDTWDAAHANIISSIGKIVEIPVVNGALSATDQFTLAGGLSIGPGTNVAVLPGGNLASDNGKISLSKLSFAGYDLGSADIGTASSTTSAVSFVFNAAATPTITFPVKGNQTSEFASSGGSCVSGTAYVAGDICTVNVSFTPNALGERDGSVVLANANGAALTVFPVYGTGTGPGLIVDPGTQTAMSDASNFKKPQAVALDGAGNAYVADSGLTNALMLPAGGGAPQPVGTGLVSPSSIAVDTAGNVYIADNGGTGGAGRIVVVPNEGGTLKSADQFVFYSGLKNPSGLAVDRFNNVYVADTGNLQVLKLAKNLFGDVHATILGSGFKNPVGVVVDTNQNVFVGDGTEGILYEIRASDGAQFFVMTGFGSAGGLALDTAGSIYVADSVNHVVSRIPLQGLSYFPNGITSVGSGFVAPQGVAIDPVGNAYVADMNTPGVFVVMRRQGLIDFGQFRLGSGSDTLVSKLYNVGNQDLTVASYSGAGDTGDFTISDPTISDPAVCPSPLKPGFTCNFSSSFQATTPGARQEIVTVSVQGNAAPAIQQTLKGEGVSFASSTITIAMTTPASGNPGFGSPVTFSATVAAGSGSTVPTGNVVFAIDETPQQPVTLASGKATFTTSAMTGGHHSVTATYKGDGATFASSVSAPPLGVDVDRATANVVVSSKSYSYGVVNTYNKNDGLILEATVTTAIKTVPTGSVDFYAGTTPLGNATVNSGFATITLSNSQVVASGLDQPGPHPLKAVYNADNSDTNFYLANSSVVSIVAMPEPTFDVASDITAMAVKPGDTGVYHITINPKYNFGLRDRMGNIAAVSFSCGDANAIAALNAAQISCLFTVTGTGSSTQTVNTAVATPVNGVFPSVTLQLTTIGPNNKGVSAALAPEHRSGSIFLAMLVPGFLGLVGLATGRKNRAAKIVATIILLGVLAVMMTACGASNSNLPAQQATGTGTPAGDTVVKVYITTPAITMSPTDSTVLSPAVSWTMQLKLTVN
jgi:trimeric autotransporter adhesin